MVELLVATRQAHPRWGPRKIRACVQRDHPDLKVPSTSTVGEVLKRFGLVKPRKRRQHVSPYTAPFSQCTEPNQVWCADFKGWFHAADGTRCEPLTISDACSRFLLRCQIVPSTRLESVQPIFETAFREFGLPKTIRTDNGPPFASVGLAGLSSLTVWWTHLGIVHERIDPGHPEQNGRHERMHRTLKQETTLPPQPTADDQQRAFDTWREEYNQKRPHEALGDRTPAEVYAPSTRRYPDKLPAITYPVRFALRPIKKSGQFYWDGVRVYAHRTLDGETLGFERLTARYWRVWFGPIELGVFDSKTLQLIAAKSAYQRLIPTDAPKQRERRKPSRRLPTWRRKPWKDASAAAAGGEPAAVATATTQGDGIVNAHVREDGTGGRAPRSSCGQPEDGLPTGTPPPPQEGGRR
jgi:transposase InsO family protein